MGLGPLLLRASELAGGRRQKLREGPAGLGLAWEAAADTVVKYKQLSPVVLL